MSTKIVEMTPAQCRAGRALLDMSQTQLAELANLGLSTVVDFESEKASSLGSLGEGYSGRSKAGRRRTSSTRTAVAQGSGCESGSRSKT